VAGGKISMDWGRKLEDYGENMMLGFGVDGVFHDR